MPMADPIHKWMGIAVLVGIAAAWFVNRWGKKRQEATGQPFPGISAGLAIVIGLPDAEKVDQLLRIPDYQEAAVLCELDVGTVRHTHAEIWAPRWTMGTQKALVEQMHAEGRRVLSWTLDNAEYIQEFLRDGDFDGILSNYPSLVAYYYYVQ